MCGRKCILCVALCCVCTLCMCNCGVRQAHTVNRASIQSVGSRQKGLVKGLDNQLILKFDETTGQCSQQVELIIQVRE